MMHPHSPVRSRTLLPLLFVLAMVGYACQPDPYPRPRGYHRIELPTRNYQVFQEPGCPFTFEYPSYAKIKLVRADSCFYDIHFPQFNCYWHLTARNLGGSVQQGIHAFEDYRQVVYKHARKGAIREFPIETKEGIGTLFQLTGNVASPLYFFFGDSAHTALECSFYFFTSEKNDSLAPVIDFLREDMLHLLRSVKFKPQAS
jgi:gliding motility-associated lipoprotein GldD